MQKNNRRGVISVLLFLTLMGCSGERPGIKNLILDVKAQQNVDQKNYEEALAKYFLMIEEQSQWSGAHSNIGVILNLLQKPEEALKSLLYARELAQQQSDKKSLFSINYNLGVYFGEKKKIKEALEAYQAALDLVPDSIETKTNIELLFQQSQESQNQNQDGEPQQNSGEGNNQQPENNQDNQNQNQKNESDQDNKGEPQSPPQSTPKYKPRPFSGENLSEGDVKKILGELRNQEKKIRANFDKKEKGTDQKNEKDW